MLVIEIKSPPRRVISIWENNTRWKYAFGLIVDKIYNYSFCNNIFTKYMWIGSIIWLSASFIMQLILGKKYKLKQKARPEMDSGNGYWRVILLLFIALNGIHYIAALESTAYNTL